MEDWYNVKLEDIKEKCGNDVVKYMNSGRSLYKTLSEVYPDVSWEPWRFAETPVGYWRSIENQRRFFDSIGQELNIQVLLMLRNCC